MNCSDLHRCDTSVFADIATVLAKNGLSHWDSTIFTLLSRFDGINSLQFEGDFPEPAREVLDNLSAIGGHVDDPALADRLTKLGFLTWRVTDTETGERWNFLQQPLADFLEGNVQPACWQWESTCPPEQDIKNWLLGKLRKA